MGGTIRPLRNGLRSIRNVACLSRRPEEEDHDEQSEQQIRGDPRELPWDEEASQLSSTRAFIASIGRPLRCAARLRYQPKAENSARDGQDRPIRPADRLARKATARVCSAARRRNRAAGSPYRAARPGLRPSAHRLMGLVRRAMPTGPRYKDAPPLE